MLTPSSRLADFPSLADRVYLNTAAEGIPSPPVSKAFAQYVADMGLGMDGRMQHEEQRAQLRAQTGRAFGLSTDEIGLCSCSSEAYNLAALALDLKAGDEVIINDLDFPAGASGWLQPSCPATVHLWRSREGALRVEDLIPLLSPRTRLITVSLVSFFNGFMIPLPAVMAAVRQHSQALLALDVTQALGRIPLEVSEADLIVSSTHKWILGPHGGGLVGVPARRATEWTVPAGGWFNLQDPFGPDRFEQVGSLPGAASFGVGMPSYGAIYAVNAALGYIHGVGIDQIAAHADPLVRQCLDGLKQLPLELLTPDEPDALAGIVALRHPQADRIQAYLHQRDIHIMSTAGRMRIAVHGYNTAADIDQLLTALAQACAQL
ncbi:MAG: aminotransferase class V-fold PLP-dependent enzyme [Candidatus Latescibacteria bacterium]|nr:aminotransferase class V-fold PLP-dependent enzyme [Candidatus Latescibacterota bacterium]